MPSWPSSTTNGPKGRRYLGLDVLARSRITLLPDPTSSPSPSLNDDSEVTTNNDLKALSA